MVVINDTDIDLLDQEPVALTIQSVRIGDLKTRSVSYTNKFKAAKSEKNNREFEDSGNVNSESLVPYRYKSAKLLTKDNKEVIYAGSALVTPQEDYYDIEIYDALLDFFSKIKGKKISELRFDDFVTWNAGLVDTNRNATSGLVSPFIDYGQVDRTAATFSIGTVVLPSVYYKTVIEKIISDAGYNKAGSIFSDDRYTKLIIPFSKDYFEWGVGFIKDREFEVSGVFVNLSGTGGWGIIDLPIVVRNGRDNEGFIYMGSPFYKWTGGGVDTRKYNLDLIVEAQIQVVSGTWTFRITDGVSKTETSLSYTAGEYYIRLAIDSKYGVSGAEGVDVSTVSSVSFEANGTAGTTAVIKSAKFYNKIYPYNYVVNPALLKFDTQDILPDTDQSSVMKDFIMRFGLVPSESFNTITFTKIKDIINNKHLSQDWTNKRDASYKEEVKTTPTQYAKANWFKYPNFDGLYYPSLADRSFSIDNDTLDSEKTFYESVFCGSSTDKVVNGSSQTIISCLIKIFSSIPPDYPAGIPGTTETMTPPGLRLAYVRSKYSSEPNVTYNGTARSDYLVGYFSDGLSANSLDWQLFIDNYYGEFVLALAKYKEVTRRYNLTDNDIASVNAQNLVYDDGAYYIIDKVMNYISGRRTKVVMHKII